jgi:hypothetical protein
VLHGIKVVIPLRHLHDGDLGIPEEPQGAIQEVRAGHMIRVERRNEVAEVCLKALFQLPALACLLSGRVM